VTPLPIEVLRNVSLGDATVTGLLERYRHVLVEVTRA
jgi:hypothetical protein